MSRRPVGSPAKAPHSGLRATYFRAQHRGPSGSTGRSKNPALAAIRSKDAYLAAQYARLKPRRGHKKALGAVKHSIICAIWHMLTTGELYNDLGGDYFRKRDPERQTKRLVAQLEELGHKVTLQQALAA